jgi:hypothetical protein
VSAPARYRAQLVEALRLVAAPAAVQQAALPPFVVVADEIALTYHDAYLLADQVAAAGLVTAQDLARLAELDAHFDALTARGDPTLWTTDALRTVPAWEEARRLAATLLAALGERRAPPDLSWITFLPAAPGPTGEPDREPDREPDNPNESGA